jgi:hypothetical protein
MRTLGWMSFALLSIYASSEALINATLKKLLLVFLLALFVLVENMKRRRRRRTMKKALTPSHLLLPS